jgi:hypothetical protein
VGSVCFGHHTGVEEMWVRNFTGYWSGSGEITGSGDSEAIELYTGDASEMNVPWHICDRRKRVVLRYNKYRAGHTAVIKYKKGETLALCNADTWHTYTGPFTHIGWIRVRVEK